MRFEKVVQDGGSLGQLTSCWWLHVHARWQGHLMAIEEDGGWLTIDGAKKEDKTNHKQELYIYTYI